MASITSLKEKLLDAVCTRSEKKVEKLLAECSSKKVSLNYIVPGSHFPFIMAASQEAQWEAVGMDAPFADRAHVKKTDGPAHRILRMVLKAGADPNIVFKNPLTVSILSPVSASAERGATSVVAIFLECGYDVNAGIEQKSRFYLWPLQSAVNSGHRDTIACMLASPTVDVGKDPRALCAACENGHDDLLRLLLAKGGKRCMNEQHPDRTVRSTPLMTACAFRQTECVAVLLEAGADPLVRLDPRASPNDPDHPGFYNTAMAFAINAGADPEVIDLLVKHGCQRPKVAPNPDSEHASRVAQKPTYTVKTVIGPDGRPKIEHKLASKQELDLSKAVSGTYISPDGTESSFIDSRSFHPDMRARHACRVCGAFPSVGQQAMVCGGCRQAVYCSREC